jgi:hypothetical protein
MPNPSEKQNKEQSSIPDEQQRLLKTRVREYLVAGHGENPDRPILTLEDLDTFRSVPKESLQALVSEVTDIVAKEIRQEQPTELKYREEAPEKVASTFAGALKFESGKVDEESVAQAMSARIAEIAEQVLEEKEIPTDLQKYTPEETVIDLDDKEQPESIRREYTDRGLELMRDVLSGIDHYAVFASTAVYLHGAEVTTGTEATDKILHRAPGDMDLAMWDRRSFGQVQERISNLTRHPQVARVELDRKGQMKQMTGQSTETWGGAVILNGEDGQEVAYHFEIFLNTDGKDRLVDPQMREMMTRKRGLSILSMEGLQRQYMKNLIIEHRVSDAAVHVDRVLTGNVAVLEHIERAFDHWASTGQWPTDPEWTTLLEEVGVAPRQLAEFYLLHQERQNTPESDTRKQQMLWTQITAILGEFKTKVAARKKKVEVLHSAYTKEAEQDTDSFAA